MSKDSKTVISFDLCRDLGFDCLTPTFHLRSRSSTPNLLTSAPVGSALKQLDQSGKGTSGSMFAALLPRAVIHGDPQISTPTGRLKMCSHCIKEGGRNMSFLVLPAWRSLLYSQLDHVLSNLVKETSNLQMTTDLFGVLFQFFGKTNELCKLHWTWNFYEFLTQSVLFLRSGSALRSSTPENSGKRCDGLWVEIAQLGDWCEIGREWVEICWDHI